jgi:hypothetical protein
MTIKELIPAFNPVEIMQDFILFSPFQNNDCITKRAYFINRAPDGESCIQNLMRFLRHYIPNYLIRGECYITQQQALNQQGRRVISGERVGQLELWYKQTSHNPTRREKLFFFALPLIELLMIVFRMYSFFLVGFLSLMLFIVSPVTALPFYIATLGIKEGLKAYSHRLIDWADCLLASVMGLIISAVIVPFAVVIFALPFTRRYAKRTVERHNQNTPSVQAVLDAAEQDNQQLSVAAIAALRADPSLTAAQQDTCMVRLFKRACSALPVQWAHMRALLTDSAAYKAAWMYTEHDYIADFWLHRNLDLIRQLKLIRRQRAAERVDAMRTGDAMEDGPYILFDLKADFEQNHDRIAALVEHLVTRPVKLSKDSRKVLLRVVDELLQYSQTEQLQYADILWRLFDHPVCMKHRSELAWQQQGLIQDNVYARADTMRFKKVKLFFESGQQAYDVKYAYAVLETYLRAYKHFGFINDRSIYLSGLQTLLAREEMKVYLLAQEGKRLNHLFTSLKGMQCYDGNELYDIHALQANLLVEPGFYDSVHKRVHAELESDVVELRRHYQKNLDELEQTILPQIQSLSVDDNRSISKSVKFARTPGTAAIRP